MHWQTILRNVFSNWASYAVTAVIGFMLSPFIVHSLGAAGYGIWTLVLSLTGYFGLLDLGIRSSVGRFLARHLALIDDERTNRTLSTAFATLAAGGALALIATLVMVSFLFGRFNVDPQFESSGRIALLIAGLNMSCVLPLGVFSSLLVAMERFDLLSGVTMIGELTRAALIILVLKLDYGLVAFAVVAMLTSVAQYTAMAVIAKALHRPLRISPTLVDRRTFRELFGFGIYRFVWITANQLVFYSQSLVIGMFLNAAAITYYAIAGTLINYSRTIVSLLTDTFYPTATRLDATQDSAGLRTLLIVGTKMSLLVALPLCLGLVFLGSHFITLWMGREYAASSAPILTVLALAQFSSMSQYMCALVLAAMARHRVLAYIALAEGVVNLILSIFLVQRMGLIGVALGMVIPQVISTVFVVPGYTLSVVQMGAGEYFRRAYLRPIIAAVPLAGIGYAFQRKASALSWALFAGETMVMCAVFAATSFFVCLDGEQRAVVVANLLRFVRRVPVIHEA